jgi:hypothetical protein
MTYAVEVVDYVARHIACSSFNIPFTSLLQIPTILSVQSHQRLVRLILLSSFQ